MKFRPPTASTARRVLGIVDSPLAACFTIRKCASTDEVSKTQWAGQARCDKKKSLSALMIREGLSILLEYPSEYSIHLDMSS